MLSRPHHITGSGADGFGGVALYIYPSFLQFYEDDVDSHSQAATVFNPYEFTVKYKVLSTAPSKYAVTEPTGLIKSKCSVDILVKHHQHAFQSDNVTDKLRIQIFQMSSNATSLVTKKDIPMFSIVCRESHFSGLPMADHQDAASGGNELLGSHHQDLVNQPYSSFTHGNSLNALMGLQTGSVTGTSSSGASGHASTTKQRPIDKTTIRRAQYPTSNENSVSHMVIFVGLVCLCIMFLPSVGSQSHLPSYVHTTFEIKLFASFVLGMVTMVILRA